MTRVIANAHALDPDYVPETLQGRDGELDELRAALQPIADGFRADPVCIFGPSGSGKTTIAKHMVHQLDRSMLDLYWGYVDAMSDSSSRDVAYRLIREMGVGRTLRREGTATSTILDRIREIDGPAVAIIDEVSFLEEPCLLATLHAIPDLTVVTITIDEDGWFSDLDRRVESRYRGATKITLDAYSHEELRAIVEERARIGLEPDVIDDGAIEVIVTRAEGDARFAIALLRRGARAVMAGEAEEISPDVVDSVEADAREAVRESNRLQLDTHQRLLYEIIREAGEIRAEEVHQRFRERTDDPDPPVRRTRTRYLNALERYGLIEQKGTGRGARYRGSEK